MWAIIGGSGFENFSELESIRLLERETPFGTASSGLKLARIGDTQFIFLSRHGAQHELLPSEVNYRANIFALKAAGARGILSFSAVGSLRKELKPGAMVIPDQYIDRTKGIRPHSFLGDGVVGHCSLAHPTSSHLTHQLASLSSRFDFSCHFHKCYVVIEGPNFSTRAESLLYRQWRADIVGMTHFPEYALAREAGLPYLPCCFVTDYDSWDATQNHVTVGEVIRIMKANNRKALEVAQLVFEHLPHGYDSCPTREQGLASCLMSDRTQLPPATQSWLEVLVGKA